MKEFENYWLDICRIHLFTKHYVLLAEELDLDGNTILQPLKEHRDAYDHIIRVYCSVNNISDKNDDDKYLVDNMSKALGHEYRAFFDTADWFSLILRERINKELEGKERDKLIQCYPKYPELREMIIEAPKKIASLRGGKDIGNNSVSRYKIVSEYADVLDTLFKSYNELMTALKDYEK